MAGATLTLTEASYPFGVTEANDTLFIYGTAAFSASPATYAAGGIAISWKGLASNKTSSAGDGTTSGTPFFARFTSVGGSGFVYVWNKSTEKLQIFTGAAAQSALTELTDGAAIPAGVSGDTIGFEARFKRF